MAKKYTPDSHMSFRLEEALKFPWRVVGTPEWIKESIPANFPASNLITVHGRSEIEIVRKPLLETRVLGVDTESWGWTRSPPAHERWMVWTQSAPARVLSAGR